MKIIILKTVILLSLLTLIISCKKSEEQKLADECCDGSIDSLNLVIKKIEAENKTAKINAKKIKLDSIKISKIVEYVRTEKPKCNTFKDIYAFKIKIKDTLGLGLKELATLLLNRNKEIEINSCEYPNFRQIFIYKNIKDAKIGEGNWLVMNSYDNGFSFAEYNNN